MPLAILVIFLSLIRPTEAGLTKGEALHLFVQGNEFYKKGEYEKAIEAYESILKAGLTSGPVYYNLGNSYFKQKRLGKAILNYERARRVIPRDSDLLTNHRYALSLRQDPLAPLAKPFWQKLIERQAAFFTLDELTLFVAGAAGITGIIFLLSLYLQWPRSQRRGILGLLAVVFFLNAFLLYFKFSFEKGQAVAVQSAEAKYEPSENATTYFSLPEGALVWILKGEGVWSKIERPDGKLGWVKMEHWESVE